MWANPQENASFCMVSVVFLSDVLALQHLYILLFRGGKYLVTLNISNNLSWSYSKVYVHSRYNLQVDFPWSKKVSLTVQVQK